MCMTFLTLAKLDVNIAEGWGNDRHKTTCNWRRLTVVILTLPVEVVLHCCITQLFDIDGTKPHGWICETAGYVKHVLFTKLDN